MLCFSITLLLAASCLAVNPGTETATTCGNDNIHRLSCDDGVISVQTALYGRKDMVTCSEGRPPQEADNTECSLAGATNTVKRMCDGKKFCELTANRFTPDPCLGTSKYLQTTYTCLPSIHSVTCEHSLAHLHCGEGRVISVYGADYGRRDKTTCVYSQPASEIQNNDCSNPTNKVAESCNGKNSCTIKASNSVFGDPCLNTYKYLEVSYACDYAAAVPKDR